jgi:hypothetical protein
MSHIRVIRILCAANLAADLSTSPNGHEPERITVIERGIHALSMH